MSISVNDLMIPIKFFNTCISDQKTEGIEYWKWHRAIGQQIDGAVLRISAIVCTLRMTFHMAPRLPRPRGRPRPRPRALPGALKAGLFILAKIAMIREANQCGTNPVWFFLSFTFSLFYFRFPNWSSTHLLISSSSGAKSESRGS